MGAITGTKAYATEFAGDYKIVVITATQAAASDTITLTLADHGISTIAAILGTRIKSGQGANFQTVYATFSGLVITSVALNAAGSNATSFGAIELVVLGY